MVAINAMPHGRQQIHIHTPTAIAICVIMLDGRCCVPTNSVLIGPIERHAQCNHPVHRDKKVEYQRHLDEKVLDYKLRTMQQCLKGSGMLLPR